MEEEGLRLGPGSVHPDPAGCQVASRLAGASPVSLFPGAGTVDPASADTTCHVNLLQP